MSDHVCTGGDGATKHHPAGGQAAHLHTIVEVSLVKTIAHLGPGLGQRRLVGGEGRGLELESARVLAAGADGLNSRVLVFTSYYCIIITYSAIKHIMEVMIAMAKNL